MKKLLTLNCIFLVIAGTLLFADVLPAYGPTFNIAAGLLFGAVIILDIVVIIGLIRNKNIKSNLRIGGFILSISLVIIAVGGVFFSFVEESFSEKPIKAYEVPMACDEVIYIYEYPPFMTSGAGDVVVCKKGVVFPLRTTLGTAPSFEISEHFVRNDTLFVTCALANQQIVYVCGQNSIQVNDSIQ